MLKPEQVPDEVVEALLDTSNVTQPWKHAIAAAINAWPGMCRFEDVTGWDVHIELPLLIPPA